MTFIFVYVTVSSFKEGKKIVLHLLEQKLIACANMFPIKSIYSWEEKMMEEKEVVLILKTREELFEQVKREIESIHSYTVPCIIKIFIEPNQAYAEWLNEQVRPKK